MADKFVTFEQLKDHHITLGRRQLSRLEARGEFPKRVQLSPGRIAWLTTEIDAHIRDKIKAREVHP